MILIKWRKGCRTSLLCSIRDELNPLPPYVPGRGNGRNWPLPPLSEDSAPLFVSKAALPALISVYEEYTDRYLVAHDYSCPPRRWLHDMVPADAGVLDHVFPLLDGAASLTIAETLLVRLVWLIQQCPGLDPVTEPDEMSVMTTVGRVGIKDGRILYRFSPEGIQTAARLEQSLRPGHIRVFSRGLNSIYDKLGTSGRLTMAQLVTRVRPKILMRELYDDGLVTAGYLPNQRSTNDMVLSIEQALMRSDNPAETLMTILVPEHLSSKEFRTLLAIPWATKDRTGVTAAYLIGKMPLVRKILEDA